MYTNVCLVLNDLEQKFLQQIKNFAKGYQVSTALLVMNEMAVLYNWFFKIFFSLLHKVLIHKLSEVILGRFDGGEIQQ